MAAKKKQQDHGGVLTLRQAMYHAVHDFEGGLRMFAAQFGLSAGHMTNKLSPTVREAEPTLKDFELILRETRDPRLLTAVCEPVSAVWHWVDEVDDAPCDLDVLARGSSLMTSASGVIDELVTALADGQIDDDEMAKIQQRLQELNKDMQLIRQTAEGFKGEG